MNRSGNGRRSLVRGWIWPRSLQAPLPRRHPEVFAANDLGRATFEELHDFVGRDVVAGRTPGHTGAPAFDLLMSGDGKRGDGQGPQATAPILDST